MIINNKSGNMKNYITFILGKIYDNTQVFYKNIF